MHMLDELIEVGMPYDVAYQTASLMPTNHLERVNELVAEHHTDRNALALAVFALGLLAGRDIERVATKETQ